MIAAIKAYWESMYNDEAVSASNMRVRMKIKIQELYPECDVDEVFVYYCTTPVQCKLTVSYFLFSEMV